MNETARIRSHKRLLEVDFIRPILILLLVIDHSFVIYSGGWPEPVGFEPSAVYSWIAKFSYSFMLETFVFISGYVFMYQIIDKQKFPTWGGVIVNKFRRLIIPSIVFSILYMLLFEKPITISEAIYQILNGVGHMWFLPMLFWCFILGWLIMKLDIKNIYNWIILICLTLMSAIPLPFQLGRAFYYLPFFIGGGFVYRFCLYKVKDNITKGRVFGLWVLFAILFVGLTVCRDYLLSLTDLSLPARVIQTSMLKLSRILYSAIGVISIYCTGVWYAENYNLNPRVTAFGKNCFGIYLFQQFILQTIYYKTDIPTVVGPQWLPWTGFAITLIISTVLSFGLSKTTIGRMLIG